MKFRYLAVRNGNLNKHHYILLLGKENAQLKQDLEKATKKIIEKEEFEGEQGEELERLRQREVALDELLHDLQSEHISLTRIYGETKKELNNVSENLQSLEKDFENNVGNDEINKRLTEQLKSELESLRLENKQRKDNEETQRKIIKDMKIVSTY